MDLYLQEFNFLIKHKSGALNKVADALSRKTCLLQTMSFQILGFDLLPEHYRDDPYFSKFYQNSNEQENNNFSITDGYLFKGNKLCVPNGSLRLHILNELRPFW